MPNPTALASLQERILDGCKAAGLAAGKMPTDRELADVAGVDASIVSHWRRGRREMGLAELVRLGDRYGEAALLPLRERFGDAVRVARADALPAAIAATADAAGFTAAVQAALVDGKITDDEAADLERRHGQAVADLNRSLMALKARAAA